MSYHKGSHYGCFGRLGAQGSAIAAFNPLVAKRCVLCRQWLSSSVFQAVAGPLQPLKQRVSSSDRKNGQVGFLKKVY